MIRLLQIEWLKLKNSRSFRILVAIWLIGFISVPLGVNALLDYFQSLGMEGNALLNIQPSDFPIFDFQDIWQNLAYAYKFITILLCFVLIVNVSNEFNNKTIRQNVIDGMSKKDFILSKILFIVLISAIASLMLTVLGFVVGFLYSPVTDPYHIFMHFDFVGAYFLHLLYHLSFCMLLSILIKRSGIIIALLIIYSYVIEPTMTSIVTFGLKMEWLTTLFPLNASWNLLPRPIEKYLLLEVQDYVGTGDVLIAAAYISLFIFSSYFLIAKRDLK